jgi:hypothetical protein
MTSITRSVISMCMAAILYSVFAVAQTTNSSNASASAVVPPLMNYSGSAHDAQGKPITSIAGATFAIYSDQSAGSPLWMETQNIHPDARGNYTIQLGASKPDGLPMSLFASGEARWLGVRINGNEEQPRALLLSVPYALKAADAETVGGLPASAFVLAAPMAGSPSQAASSQIAVAGSLATGTTPVTTAGGTVNKVPKYDANADITSSQIFDNGTNVSIGNTAPAAKLDVSGTGIFRGALTLPAIGAATASTGKNSQPMNFTASAFNSSMAKAVNQTFRWQSEPVGNNSITPSAKLNLLYGSGTATPAETGLSISNKGIISFASGQTFPGGSGTVTSVGLSAPAADFTVSGSPVTQSGTLALNWIIPPTSSDTPNAIVKRDSTGAFQSSQITATTNNSIAIVGQSNTNVGVSGFSPSSYGVAGTSQTNVGVVGQSVSQDGVAGQSNSGYGVFGLSQTTAGVVGASNGTEPTSSGYGPDGVVGIANGAPGTAVDAFNNAGGDALLAFASSPGDAGFFSGNVTVEGNLSKSGGSFKIDHPLDPASMYLYHSFVESPDMMNIYNGEVTLDANGQASVSLPNWFESLNQDFRYQLTAIGGPAPNLYIAEKVHNNSFKIAGGRPSMEVSWQVTGIRHDAWANAHRIPVEVPKSDKERGLYLHPELFGASKEKSIAAARHPVLNRLGSLSVIKSEK